MNLVGKSKLPDGRFLGVPEPRIFRKRPHEAYTAQAYFFLYWWYRAYLWLVLACIVAFAFVSAALAVTLWAPLVYVAVWQVAALFVLAGARLVLDAFVPDNLATLYDNDDEAAS